MRHPRMHVLGKRATFPSMYGILDRAARIIACICTVIPIVIGASSARAQGCQFLCNTDFEDAMVYAFYPQFINEAQFPCWSTTASDNIIEVWSDPSYEGAYSYSGGYFIELNANEFSSIFQDFTATPGAQVVISFAHRARWYGNDVMAVEIGHDGTFYNVTTASDDSVGWGYYTVPYNLPVGGSNTFTIRFTAISSGSGSPTVGNFIDAVSVSLQPPDVSLTSTNATCPGSDDGSATATVTGGAIPYQYAWSSGAGSAPQAVDLGPGAYTCTVTDANGCVDSATVTITEGTGPSLTLQSTPVTCHGGYDGSASSTVSSGTAPFGYTWSPVGGSASNATGLPADTYQCTVIDAHGCSTAADVTVTEPTAVVATTADALICIGDQAQLIAQANGGTPGYTFTWTPSGPNVSPTVTTPYSVIATDSHGCQSQPATATVTVPQLPEPVFDPDTNGCAPVCVVFHSNATANLTCTWSFGDGTSGSGAGPQHCYTDAGVYGITLTFTDANGCHISTTVDQFITVRPSPVAEFEASSTIVALDEAHVLFHDATAGATTWHWSFGDADSTTADGPDPNFTFPLAGCYTVRLEVTNSAACTDTTSQEICVRDVAAVYVPNTFTPDGDGYNELFGAVVSGGVPRTFELTVFDRWGEVIFDSEAPERSWDGDGVPEGVYAWRLQYTIGSAHNDRYGHVTLLR